MKVINDLLGFNMKIVQDTDFFNFSLDSVLLYNFLNLKPNMKVIDICSGNCPIPMLISTIVNNKIYAVEIQKEVYELGKESIEINNLYKNIDADTYDIITCNPPYFKVNEETKKNDNKIKSIARHEIEITLEDIIKLSRKLLKNNGSLVLVHRPERLSEIIVLMEKNNISPKRIQFIYPKENTESNMIIIEGTKNGNNALKVLEPLIIHEENGDYRKEIENIFKGC